MRKLLIAAAVLAPVGCRNTWNGAKVDSSRIVGRSVNGIGHDIGKAGAALGRSGEQTDGRVPAQSTNNAIQQPH